MKSRNTLVFSSSYLTQFCKLSAIFLFFIGDCCSNSIWAASTTWTGAADHDWFNSSNWDNGVPGLLDTATISSDSVTINANADIMHLVLKNTAVVISPAGKLRIISSDGIGVIADNSNLYNYGLVRIFSPESTGLFLTGTSRFRNLSGSRFIIDLGTAEPIIIGHNATLENFNNALIQSDTCIGALVNNGELLNDGNIKLIHSRIGGFLGEGSLENNGHMVNLGQVEIDSSGANGILSAGTLENSGTLHIHNCDRFGIQIQISGNIENSGTLDIHHNLDGISLLLQSTLINTGDIRIYNISDDGINGSSLSLFENRGEIEIHKCGSYGLVNGGKFENYNFINIDTFGTPPMLGPAGIYNYDTLYNDAQGVIQINGQNITANSGIRNMLITEGVKVGVIINHGDIFITQTDDNGIINHGEIRNFKKLDIRNLSLGSPGILNHGLLVNMDSLIIEDLTNTGIYNYDLLVNIGSLIIKDLSNSGIYNFDSLQLESGGNILIENAGSNGISNTPNGVLTNLGYLNLIGSAIGNSGLIINRDSIIIFNPLARGIDNQDSIVNDDTGVIHILDVQNYSGITNGSGTDDSLVHFENLGYIKIHNTPEYGVSNYGIFKNEGKLFIDSIDSYGINNSGDFINADSLFIQNTEGYGFYNLDSLHNTSNGVIEITDIRNSSYGIFNDFGHYLINDGAISVKQTTDAGILNIGQLINNNIIDIENVERYGIWNHIGTLSNSIGASISVNGVTGDFNGHLLFNDNMSTLINAGYLSLSTLNIINGTNVSGIKCTAGTTLEVTSDGTLILQDIMNVADFMDVEAGAIMTIEGELDIQN